MTRWEDIRKDRKINGFDVLRRRQLLSKKTVFSS